MPKDKLIGDKREMEFLPALGGERADREEITVCLYHTWSVQMILTFAGREKRRVMVGKHGIEKGKRRKRKTWGK